MREGKGTGQEMGAKGRIHISTANQKKRDINIYKVSLQNVTSSFCFYWLKTGNAVIVVPALGACISPMKTDYTPIGELGNSPTSVNAPSTEDKKTRVPSEHNE